VNANAVINRLERMEFVCTEEWGGTYQLKINRQVSGLPERVAKALSEKLTEVCKHIAEECRNELKKNTLGVAEALPLFSGELGTSHNDVGNGDSLRVSNPRYDNLDPRD
jgi:hypothetical protein